jgi:transcription elongation factor GreB
VSKAFTKDDDAGAAPVVPRRAPLPAGTPNYVTPRGLALLRAELAELGAELGRVRADAAPEGAQRMTETTAVLERIAELEARIASAELVSPTERTPDEVRFGARVTVKNHAGNERSYQLVGVDEAKASEGRIAFVAPLARALLGKRAGDAVLVRTPHGDEEFEVLRVEYEPPAV